MWNDPILEELYKHWQEMSAKFNYDIHALYNYYRERPKLENHPVVSFPPSIAQGCAANYPTSIG
jgi:hypothetical protein